MSAASELSRLGADVVVYETRDHIGGNCHDAFMDGVLVHQYGGHVLNTHDVKVVDFVKSFCVEWKEFRVKVVAWTDKGLIPVPFNNISAEIVGDLDGEKISNLIFKNYSAKQWGRDWDDLPEHIRNRVPVRRYTDDCIYHDKPFSGIPKTSYSEFFSAMADGVEIHTGCKNDDWKANKADAVIYTGPIDEYFNHNIGKLRFRSLRWEYAKEPKRYYHIINDCTNGSSYTRSVDHSHWLDQYIEKTVIGYEYPEEYEYEQNLPMYPHPDASNEMLASAYRALAKLENKTVFAGRLGTNRYIDMDEAIRQGRDAARKVMGE